MHGRLKLRPPDAARRRQREEKLRLYRSAMAALLEKRARGELDAEVLELTGAVLAANPDVGTCWNLRRCALPAQGGDWVPGELAFVGGCLGVNPKSYGAWHHRGWVLGHAPAPPPAPAERALCDRLLGADPRNFHAWEHRRALAAEPDPAAELAFAASLLRRDFSNFSAWHHRGRLLAPARAPPPGGALPLPRLRAELELVQHAVFTDPADQSAWLYLRCLLSRASPPPRVLCVAVDREDAALAVTFSRAVRVGAGQSQLVASLDGSTLEGAWRSGEGRARASHTWLCDLPPDLAPPTSPLHFRVTWVPGSTHHEVTLPPGESEAWWQEPIAARELFWPEVGVAEAGVLQAQVQMCRQLLELEPHSRGCLLTLLLLLSALDPLGHAEEMRRCLRDLQEADPLRRGFVGDVASRAEVALGVLRLGEGPGGERRLRLPGKALTSLPLLEHLVLLSHLDLADNQLGALPPTLGGLRRLQVLDLARNKLRSLEGLPPLPRLEELCLDGNPISHASALAPLAACPRLARLRLVATPLAAAPDAAPRLAELLPHVAVTLA